MEFMSILEEYCDTECDLYLEANKCLEEEFSREDREEEECLQRQWKWDSVDILQSFQVRLNHFILISTLNRIIITQQSLESLPTPPVQDVQDEDGIRVSSDSLLVVNSSNSSSPSRTPLTDVFLAMELCKIKREFSNQSVNRQRERSLRRKMEKDNYRQRARDSVSTRSKEIRESKMFLESLKEQREVSYTTVVNIEIIIILIICSNISITS